MSNEILGRNPRWFELEGRVRINNVILDEINIFHKNITSLQRHQGLTGDFFVFQSVVGEWDESDETNSETCIVIRVSPETAQKIEDQDCFRSRTFTVIIYVPQKDRD